MSILPPTNGSMTPDKAIGMLFYFHDQAAFNHLQTRSFARHKALDELYSGLESFRDGISELLLGYVAPKRIAKAPSMAVNLTMSDEQLVDQVCKFADELYEYGEKTKWWALSNQAADLSGLGTKVKYLFTLE